ncbi:ribulokinase [Salinicoccus hispanicus]|uniref:Ribulokinase n=1 Tax=Salinicoccus hispanicus TaxID=157225 RepID=A0A6N8TYF3_9STAP|nr:ribulokinase [Salinicoccus hispanicus]MXQ51018.1 ribulokinase [Salinicoccus hispanicus]
MDGNFAVGLDFGTESARAVLVSLENGQEIADHVVVYQHGVINEKLPYSDVRLGPDWALQHPDDYIGFIKVSILEIVRKSGVSPEKIVGIGVGFTSCTMLPVDDSNTPLCLNPKFAEDPNSWVKLWKHHAAQKAANKLNHIASERKEPFLHKYGGKISSEWMIPKILQIHEESRDIYEAADRFVEAGDWVVSMMTGNYMKSSCAAGYKALWNKGKYPSNEFFKALDPDLEKLTETKLRGEIHPLGTKAGELTEELAADIGLPVGTAVAVSIIDAHASVPAMGITGPGKMVMAMGTSICHLVLGEEEVDVEGISGVVEDGIIPGFYGYEAGQPAGGDIFAWYLNNSVPKYVEEAANLEDLSLHDWLEREAAILKPGESGLLALDWWNGNRTTLVDAELSGLLVGMSLDTKPEEIYRALLESLAFGTRKVIDTFEQNGILIEELYACGGLPNKNSLLMQIFADITNRTIKIADTSQTPAIGAAMYGAVAAGKEKGGFDNIEEAAEKMKRIKDEYITPIAANVEAYEKIYEHFNDLYNYFGKDSKVMKSLLSLRTESKIWH